MDNQKLLDIMVECALIIHTHKSFENKTYDEIGEYIRRQLEENGIKTKQLGSKLAVLVD